MKIKQAFKDSWNNNKKEIIVGLITSAIWGIGITIVKSAPQMGKTFLGTIINVIYSCASKISLNSIINYILLMISGLLTAVAFIPLLDRYLNKKFKTRENRIKQEINNIKEEKNNDNKQKKIIDYLDSEKDAMDKRLIRGGKLLLITFILCLLIVVFTVIIPLDLLDSFEYNIKMIKPYTDTKTVMMLESDWTRMKSKDDYDKIYDTINKIKDENNLPKK